MYNYVVMPTYSKTNISRLRWKLVRSPSKFCNSQSFVAPTNTNSKKMEYERKDILVIVDENVHIRHEKQLSFIF